MDNSVIIIGGGGHSRVLIGMLKRAGTSIRGIVTRDVGLVGRAVLGVPVLGLEDAVMADMAGVQLINGVGNVASRHSSGLGVRAGIYARYRERGFQFFSAVSGDAILQSDVALGDGVQVMPGVVIQPGAVIGDNVILNTRASIDHDAVIHAHAHIAPGAIVCGGATVGALTHVGAGAVIIQGIHVGSHAVIGAGAVVTRHVPDYAVVRPSASEQVKANAAKMN